MTRLASLVLITFLQNFTLLLVGEGVYFYTDHLLHFTVGQNMGLALARGVIYVLAALMSHRISSWLGERRLLLLAMLGQAGAYAMIWAMAGNVVSLVSGIVIYNVFSGMKWPVIESYFSAGRTPRESSKMIGWFNLAWSSASGVGLALSGSIIASARPEMLFAISVAIDLVNTVFLVKLEPRLVHLALDHPERLPAERVRWFASLLRASRGSLLLSYTLFYVISPLLPALFNRVAVPVMWATVFAALLHVARFATFVALQRFDRWHGQVWVAIAAIVGLPVGFLLIVCDLSLAALIGGQIVFGLAAGLTYYAALYYAMVVKDSSVDASGKHEAIIGSGAVVGPIVGLASMGMGAGIIPGMSVVILAATVWSSRALMRGRVGGLR